MKTALTMNGGREAGRFQTFTLVYKVAEVQAHEGLSMVHCKEYSCVWNNWNLTSC